MNSDILFQTEDVCILNPKSSRGILVFTIASSKNICTEGILSHNELRKRHPELGLRDRYHKDPRHDDLIFFRAPYNSDTSTLETSYGGKIRLSNTKQGAIATIRIDPTKTFVYSSETRVYGNTYDDILRSRIPMTEYLSRIKDHSTFIAQYPNKSCGNIFTYEKKSVPSSVPCKLPWIEYLPIERTAEVVVQTPIIPTEWLVSCESNNVGGYKSRKKSKKYTRKNQKHNKKRSIKTNPYLST